MIDLHSHIIYGVDDGPKSLEESLALIELAYEQGVRTIVATSHRRKGMFETPEAVIWNHFQEVKQASSDVFPDLELLYGAELYYTEDLLTKLEQNQVPTLANTRLALIEFSSRTLWKDMQTAIHKVIFLGITPVLAHIERYNALEYEAERVRELIKMGCYTQVNSSSVLKPKLFGDQGKLHKKRAEYFLKNQLVHVISSDMHNGENRPPYMRKAFEQVVKRYGQKRATDLFVTYPKSLLEDQYL